MKAAAIERSNRRADNRVIVNWPGRVGRRGMGVYQTRIRNLSISGLYLETTQKFPLAGHLLMEIGAKHGGETRKLLCEGSVMRAEPLTGGLYGYGIRFLRLRDSDLSYLLAVVAELWTREETGVRAAAGGR